MRLIVLLILFPFATCFSQFIDDFSDGELTQNPTWQGDVDNFIVNEDFQLQLNAPEAGNSFLYSSVELLDSIEWEFYFLLDFSPSTSNSLKIFLSLDNLNFSEANGYFLEIGESGASDAIQFKRLDNGSEITLGSATMGAVGSDPAVARVKVKKTENGTWTLWADYNGTNFLLEELSLSDATHSMVGTRWFGFDCTYTSTRTDKFFFDDVRIGIPVADVIGPELLGIEVSDANCFRVTYNENIDVSNLDPISLYIIPNIGNPIFIEEVAGSPNVLNLKFTAEIESGIIYTFCSEEVFDESGNPSSMECEELFLTTSPKAGDLYVNEILFNPISGGSDFIELINTSSKFITLDEVSIVNNANGQSKSFELGHVLLPNEIMAFTEDVEHQIDTYSSLAPENIVFQDLPAFNADEGNVSLYVQSNSQQILIDSFDYSEDLHFVLLDNEKGVSLEKLRATASSNDPNSWHSASENVLFATPGYTNSNFFVPNTEEGRISFENLMFSPNGDGFEELLIISFNLETPGHLATVKIFDDRGYLVKDLSSNQLIGTNTFISWDGVTDEGVKAKVGIYIALVELVDVNGSVEYEKKSFVLADFLD